MNDAINFWSGLFIFMRALSTVVKIAVTGGLLAALSFLTPAHAGPTFPKSRTWTLTSSSGTQTTGTMSFNSTAGDYSITAKAYKVAKKSGQPNTNYRLTDGLAANTLGKWSNGLGVENLSAPEHAVDNNNGWDFIVFKLPAGNTWNTFSFVLDPYGTRRDMHATVLYGNPNASLGISGVNDFAGKSVNQLLAGGFLSMNFDGVFLDNTNQAQTIAFNTTTQVNYIIIAASLQPFRVSDDNFKVKSITGSLVVRVPEPAAWTAFGAGLLGLGVFATRRRRAVKRA
jgi:MYXO-CTERM domain-containing protein